MCKNPSYLTRVRIISQHFSSDGAIAFLLWVTTKKAFHKNILNILNILNTFCMNKLAAELVHDTKWHQHSKKAWRRFRRFEIKLIGIIIPILECCDFLDNKVCQDKTNHKTTTRKLSLSRVKHFFLGDGPTLEQVVESSSCGILKTQLILKLSPRVGIDDFNTSLPTKMGYFPVQTVSGMRPKWQQELPWFRNGL